MGWRDLIEEDEREIVAPWLGGIVIRAYGRSWTMNIRERRPPEFGWFSFGVRGRHAYFRGPAERPSDPRPVASMVGYLVGDRLVRDDVRVDPAPLRIVADSDPVYLIDSGIDRFTRVRVGRLLAEEPLVFLGVEMPLGPEAAVLSAYLDQKASIDDVPGVPSALDAAFRMETWLRTEEERRRMEIERARREEEEQRLREERRQEIERTLGSSAGRREMALVDFAAAATAALAVGGATYLDHRTSTRRGEMVVRFRFIDRRFECTCDARTLRIVDAGICLTAHGDDEFEDGTRGDRLFTLESLPGVIQQASREDRLVVTRH